MDNQKILDEVEDLLRSMPKQIDFRSRNSVALAWAGRAKAILKKWDTIETIGIDSKLTRAFSPVINTSAAGYADLTILIQQARHDLLLETVGPRSVVIAGGGVFDYFDEIRKIIETAVSDLFFVDPYLDAEFAARYLKSIPAQISIRLLGSKRRELDSLLAAVGPLRQQYAQNISVRSTREFHDRYLFIDRNSCFQSGASFKDGAKRAPVVLTQIVDAFPAVLATYENLWNAAATEM